MTFKEWLKEKKLSELPDGVQKGIKSWVEDYKSARKAGNIKLAKQIKSNIDKEIKKFKLDSKEVYGKDPDDPKNK